MTDVLNVSNITQLVVTPLTLASMQLLYDILVSGYSTQQALYDGGLAAVSIAASKILSDAFSYKLVGGIDSAYLTSLSSYAVTPTANYFIYNWLYSTYFRKKYLNTKAKKGFEMVGLPIITGLLAQFADDAVLNFFGFWAMLHQEVFSFFFFLYFFSLNISIDPATVENGYVCAAFIKYVEWPMKSWE